MQIKKEIKNRINAWELLYRIKDNTTEKTKAFETQVSFNMKNPIERNAHYIISWKMDIQKFEIGLIGFLYWKFENLDFFDATNFILEHKDEVNTMVGKN